MVRDNSADCNGEQLNCNSVRIHANLALQPWARFWYWLRAIDVQGRGWVIFETCQATAALDCSISSLYRWLHAGRAAGAIRAYRRQGDRWQVWLGGLAAVCRALGLADWGLTFSIEAEELRDLERFRAWLTGCTTIERQEQSRYQAFRALPKPERRALKLPSTFETLTTPGILSSLQAPAPIGASRAPCVLSQDDKRIYVSAGFIPFGASQETIAATVRRSDRTVRRHHAAIGLVKRQLCQTKGAYRVIYQGLQHGCDSIAAGAVSYDGGWLSEPVGCATASHSERIAPARLFEYRGRVWLARCNLYGGAFEQHSMKAARRAYLKSLGLDLVEIRERQRAQWRLQGLADRDFWGWWRSHKQFLLNRELTIMRARGADMRVS